MSCERINIAVVGKCEKEGKELCMTMESEFCCLGYIVKISFLKWDREISQKEADSFSGVFILEGEGENEASRTFVGTSHLRLIPKENRETALRNEIEALLGYPEPLEIERKFLIEMPDVDSLMKNHPCRRVHISQTYLASSSDEEVRVRKRGEGDSALYYKTVKKKLSDVKRSETEARITKEEYEAALCHADPERGTIEKDRYCFVFGGRYFELDVYPFFEDRAVVEVELLREDEDITLPSDFKLIKEVTKDSFYKNASLAKLIKKG